MMKRKNDFGECCSLCEYGEEIFSGEFCICKKKGVVLPTDLCSSFLFDPLKVKVSARKIPDFKPLSNIMKE